MIYQSKCIECGGRFKRHLARHKIKAIYCSETCKGKHHWRKKDKAKKKDIVITFGLIGSPFDRKPQPQHMEKTHNSWHPKCKLCRELKAYVAEITGIDSGFSEHYRAVERTNV